ncbi:MAG: ClpXP protease specificity-enhancing factor SspB [Pseudomonadota bacterium]
MTKDLIRYDLLAQEALRGLVRRVLSDAEEQGLPGEHHFYIKFATDAPGVLLSPRMREQYPEEMTIVLQHQFWDLEVERERFSVTLSFNAIPERLTVPFSAIRGFFDPSVQFGLEFEAMDEDAPATNDADEPVGTIAGLPSLAGTLPPGDPADDNEASAETAEPESGDSDADTDDETGSATVVSLDQFRKKAD